MKYLIVWESAGCDGECGTVMVSDSECGAVLDGDSEYGIVGQVIVSVGHSGTVIVSVGQCRTSDREHATVLDSDSAGQC